MATTFETFRGEVATKVAAVAPVSHADVLFRQHRDETDLREWAAQRPDSCFRRFAIRDLVEYDPPDTSTYEEEWVSGRFELVIAYPADGHYGPQNKRDQRDLMRADEKYVDETIGLEAWDDYTEGWCVREMTEHEEGPDVSFLAMTYGFQFYRSR